MHFFMTLLFWVYFTVMQSYHCRWTRCIWLYLAYIHRPTCEISQSQPQGCHKYQKQFVLGGLGKLALLRREMNYLCL